MPYGNGTHSELTVIAIAFRRLVHFFYLFRVSKRRERSFSIVAGLRVRAVIE